VSTTDWLVGVAVLVGLVGVVVPVLPGSVLVLAAVLVWAVLTATTAAWVVFAAVAVLLVAGAVVKYAVPGRRLRTEGVPHRTLLVGAAVGAVGFFVVPLVGLVLGFVVGVYLSELQRVGRGAAWRSTGSALRAVGLSVLIELTAALAAAATWLVGALVIG
jgi:uncharacterized protein YqgC (DUF456 family)